MANKAGALHTVEGSKATRRSPRVYTHAIVATFDHAMAVASAIKNATSSAADRWDYEAGEAVKTGNEPLPAKEEWRRQYMPERIAEAKKFIAQHPDREAFIKGRVEESVANIKTPDGELIVLSWSQSAANANKALNTFAGRASWYSCKAFRVVPVNRKG